ncbi:Protein of unknown function, partial [Gryllus bimaculatus]
TAPSASIAGGVSGRLPARARARRREAGDSQGQPPSALRSCLYHCPRRRLAHSDYCDSRGRFSRIGCRVCVCVQRVRLALACRIDSSVEQFL